jgi:hypothetical protein
MVKIATETTKKFPLYGNHPDNDQIIIINIMITIIIIIITIIIIMIG